MDRHIVNENISLREALGRLNDLSGDVMTLLAIDNDERMTGTLTDGDIRRHLISGASLDTPVADAIHRNFQWLEEGNIDVARLKAMRCRSIRLVPVLDADRRIAGIIDTNVTRTVLPVSALLMAGGKGERLRPMTLTTPKPLLEIAGKPIIDYNIEALAAVGISDITVTTNYLAEQLHDHFSRPVAGVEVKCLRETTPLGTIGAAGLKSHPEGKVTLVMNSDLLTTVSFEEMYLKHQAEGASITIAAIPYNVSVPYAILDTDGERVTALEEKPSYAFYANAGIYLIDNSLLSKLDGVTRVDATDLIEQAIADGLKVIYYPINGTWIDIGSPVDFNHARELMKHHQQMSD